MQSDAELEDVESGKLLILQLCLRQACYTFAEAYMERCIASVKRGALYSPKPAIDLMKKVCGDVVTPTEGAFIAQRFAILKSHNFKCTYCGRGAKDGVKLEIDHIIPRSKGGSDHPSNLTVACKDCNIGKKDVMLAAHQLKKMIDGVEDEE